MTAEVDPQVAAIVANFVKEGLYPETGLFPTPQQWKALLEAPAQGRIHFVSFFKFAPGCVPTVEQMDWKGTPEEEQGVVEKWKKLGVKELALSQHLFTLVGEDNGDWDMIRVIEFANRDAFVQFYTDPAHYLPMKGQDVLVKQRTIIARDLRSL